MAHILVADDDRDIRELVMVKLRSLGHQVTMVADGREAIDALAGQAFDAAILDVMMPFATGLDVLTHVRATPVIAGLPVLMMSAACTPSTQAALSAAGADSFLPKPFTMPALAAWVTALPAA